MTRITDTLHEDLCTCVIISCWILPRIRNIPDKIAGKSKTHILCSITFFENRALFEIKWKNSVKPKRPQITLK